MVSPKCLRGKQFVDNASENMLGKSYGCQTSPSQIRFDQPIVPRPSEEDHHVRFSQDELSFKYREASQKLGFHFRTWPPGAFICLIEIAPEDGPDINAKLPFEITDGLPEDSSVFGPEVELVLINRHQSIDGILSLFTAKAIVVPRMRLLTDNEEACPLLLVLVRWVEK
jgi:hypothetical protein